jgi:hypothetical protein
MMISWGWGCPGGMLAQLTKKIPKTAPSTKRFNMAKPPNSFIKLMVMIEARFIPK